MDLKSSSNTELWIHETFQNTLQGEGSLTGTPADFIRLSGCPVGCNWCDTGYSNSSDKKLPRFKRSIPSLLAELESNLVVVTGGEPFIQIGLSPLCEAIALTQRQVAIETSGSFWQPIPSSAWLTVSPKEHIRPGYPVKPEIWQRASEVKIVISTGVEVEYYQEKLESLSCPIFLQPEWGQRDRTIPLTLELLKKHRTYRLSLQTHKLLNIP
jgi:organic radical activating enzyme